VVSNYLHKLMVFYHLCRLFFVSDNVIVAGKRHGFLFLDSKGTCQRNEHSR